LVFLCRRTLKEENYN